MNREAVKQVEYKGYKINIYQDENYDDLEDWGDESLFLVGYHRDFTVDRSRRNKEGRSEGGISQELAQCIARGGKYEDGSRNDEAAEYVNKYHVFGLEAYIHSGVCLALSNEGQFPDRQWDVSQLGLVFVSKKEWRIRKKARKAALGLIKEWNDYLSGNVYGYMIEDKEGNESGGCWGYYGDYDDKSNDLISSAKSEIDYQVKEDRAMAKVAIQALA